MVADRVAIRQVLHEFELEVRVAVTTGVALPMDTPYVDRLAKCVVADV